MTTSSIHPPKPRRRGVPSERDQQIYLDYQTTGRTQTELAEQYGLTQCRISQIICRVEAWLAGREQHRLGAYSWGRARFSSAGKPVPA